jgi:uncharacterized Zn finger protein
MIKLKCPSCGQMIEVPEEKLSEDQIACPACGHEFKPPTAAEEKALDRWYDSQW